MRLLILFDILSPAAQGGLERRNDELARALCDRGHEVTVCGLGEPPRDKPYGVLSLGSAPPLYNRRGRRTVTRAFHYARRVASLDLRPYDVVETASLPYAHLFPLARACARRGIPLAVTWYEFWGRYWASYVGAAKAPVFRLIERLAAGLGNRVAASCQLTAARLRACRQRVQVIPCGLDVDKVVTAGERRSGQPAAPVAFAGRLQDNKRVDLLLRAVARMSRHGLVLSVFGDGPERARLERLAAELGLGERVEFRGFVPTSRELWSALSSAQIAVQPSAREGFGLFPLEAMALGLTVVYCKSPESAVGELVRDGTEGIACEAEPTALAQALDGLLDSPAQRERFAQAARRRANEYRWDCVAKLYLDWLDFPPGHLAGTRQKAAWR
jgi:glycosyltransferase involved in cell wall biosynthesis